jgi:hypothetical protein
MGDCWILLGLVGIWGMGWGFRCLVWAVGAFFWGTKGRYGWDLLEVQLSQVCK